MMIDIFKFSSYKSYVTELLNSHSHERGFQAKLSKAAGCQPSYLSQSLSGKTELTPDHAIGIAQFIQLSKLETEYLLNLVHLSRAKGPALRKVVNEKLSQLKKENSLLSKRIEQESSQSEIDFFYYSSWIYLAIHMCLSVEALQTEEALAKRLGVSTQYLQRILKQLQLYGLAKEKAGRWVAIKKGTHLGPESFMTEVNHANWRNRAIIDVQRDPMAWVHYTSVFSMSRSDSEKLREMILEFIEKARKVIRPSPEEEVYCMLLDFFEI